MLCTALRLTNMTFSRRKCEAISTIVRQNLAFSPVFLLKYIGDLPGKNFYRNKLLYYRQRATLIGSI
jgi:hypothetical protein